MMYTHSKIILFLAALTLGVSAFAAYGHAASRDKDKSESNRESAAEHTGYLLGKIIDNDGDDKKRVYRGKKLYENKDVVITRYYNIKGKKYTVVTRK